MRNPLALLGDGYIQQLGVEMTANLQAQLAAAKSAELSFRLAPRRSGLCALPRAGRAGGVVRASSAKLERVPAGEWVRKRDYVAVNRTS